MANHQGNGRNAAKADEHRPSWRAQDENGKRRSTSADDDRGFVRDRDVSVSDRDLGAHDRNDERFASRDRMDSQWEDRSERWDDRDDRSRSTEYYGQGQSGYAAGRYEGDRAFGSRNQASGGDVRNRDRGLDERFVGGRGGDAWRPDDRDPDWERNVSGYGQDHRNIGGGHVNYGRSGHPNSRGDGDEGHGYGYQGNVAGQRQHRYDSGAGTYGPPGQRGHGSEGGQGVRNQGGMYGQGGYNDGMYGQGGMQNRYGSQGYQGYGQPQQGAQQTNGQGSQAIGAAQSGWNQQAAGVVQSHRGKGPSGYVRSDDRIKEIVCEVLTDHHEIDATHVEISVKNGEVTLSGTVEDRSQKRLVEDVIENLSCVKDVVNQLRIGAARSASSGGRETSSTSTSSGESQASTSGTGSDKRHRA